MSERLLTLPQAADQLACSLATLKRRILRGDLPVFRDGRLIRIRQADLDTYIDERVCLPTQRRKAARAATGAPLTAASKLFDLPDPLT